MLGKHDSVTLIEACAFWLQRSMIDLLTQFLHELEGMSTARNSKLTSMMAELFFASRMLLEQPFKPIKLSYIPGSESNAAFAPYANKPAYEWAAFLLSSLSELASQAKTSGIDKEFLILDGATRKDMADARVEICEYLSKALIHDPHHVLSTRGAEGSENVIIRCRHGNGAWLVRLGYIYPITLYRLNGAAANPGNRYLYNTSSDRFFYMPTRSFPPRWVSVEPDYKHKII